MFLNVLFGIFLVLLFVIGCIMGEFVVLIFVIGIVILDDILIFG